MLLMNKFNYPEGETPFSPLVGVLLFEMLTMLPFTGSAIFFDERLPVEFGDNLINDE